MLAGVGLQGGVRCCPRAGVWSAQQWQPMRRGRGCRGPAEVGGLSAGWGWHAGWREMQPVGWCLVSAAVAADASRKGVQGASGVGGSGGAGVGRLRGAVWLPGCMQQVHAWASLLGQDARPACRTPCNSAQQSARPAKAQQRKRAAQRLTFLRACWNMSRTRLAPTPVNISMNSVPAAAGSVQHSRTLYQRD